MASVADVKEERIHWMVMEHRVIARVRQRCEIFAFEEITTHMDYFNKRTCASCVRKHRCVNNNWRTLDLPDRGSRDFSAKELHGTQFK